VNDVSQDGRLRQLTLPLSPPDHHSFESYVPGPNVEALLALRGLIDRVPRQALYLWGGQATGKTHLVDALCRSYTKREHRVAYIPLLEAVGQYAAELLDHEELPDLLCLDDIQAIGGSGAWEMTLFEVFNRMLDQGRWLVFTANVAPSALPVTLVDLKSRLEASLTFRLRSLDDSGKREVLKSRAAVRGFELPDAAADYMLHRLPRDLGALLRVLDGLDTASLAAHRRLTLPFLKSLLEGQFTRFGSE